jgi:hypothetical protein
VREGKRDRGRTRWVERDQEPGHDAAVHIHRQCQARAPDRPAHSFVHHYQVHRRVVHLENIEQPRRLQAARHRAKPLRRNRGTIAGARNFGSRLRRHAPAHGVEARRLETRLPTLVLNSVEQCGAGQLLTLEIELLDTALDDGANFRGKPIRTLRRAAWCQDQAGGPRIRPVAAQEFIYLALAEPQLQTGVRHSLIRQSRARRQLAKDRFPPASLQPGGLWHIRQRL